MKMELKLICTAALGILLTVAYMFWRTTTTFDEKTGKNVDDSSDWHEASYTVQHRDFTIRVVNPKNHYTSTQDHTIITGCHVTVIYPDAVTMVGAPQCHWDGINSSTEYTYTINYYIKGDRKGMITSCSLNLLDFAAIFKDGKGLSVVPMGVLPDDGFVRFRNEKFTGVLGSDPRNLSVK